MNKGDIKMRTVKVNQIELGSGIPKICVPMTGSTKERLLEEAVEARTSGADLVEWRIDWYDDVFDYEQLKSTANLIKQIIGDMPMLMTFRTTEEGGQKAVSNEKYEELIKVICEHNIADMVDVEAFKEEEMVKRLIAIAKETEVITVGSNHDFDKTPSKAEIVQRLCYMQNIGFNITKIAVMPQKERDVLTLLDATLTMKECYADRPFITMSMTKMGAVSRMAGECFGSCLTFGTAGASSAPGQIDAKELKIILDLLHE